MVEMMFPSSSSLMECQLASDLTDSQVWLKEGLEFDDMVEVVFCCVLVGV